MNVSRALTYMADNRNCWRFIAAICLFQVGIAALSQQLLQVSGAVQIVRGLTTQADLTVADWVRFLTVVMTAVLASSLLGLASFVYATQIIDTIVTRGTDLSAPQWKGITWLLGGVMQYVVLGLIVSFVSALALFAFVVIMAVSLAV